MPSPNALPAVWNAVVGWLGMPETPEVDLEGSHEEQLAALAWRTHLRTRRVGLSGRWWRRDCGPLIAFLRDDGRPVALLPKSWGGYQLVDPASGAVKVTDAVAAGLEPFGFAVYRSFPRRRMGLAEVLRFGAGPLKGDIAMLIVAGLAASAVVAGVAVAGEKLVDGVIPADEASLFVAFGAALLTSAVALGLAETVRTIALIRVAGRMRLSLQGAVWGRILEAPVPFFRRYPTGDLAERAFGIDVLEQVVAGPGVAAALTLLTSVTSWIVLLAIDPLLTVVAGAIGLTFVAVAGLAHARTHRDRRRLVDAHGEAASLLFELLNGIAHLKVAAAEQRAFSAWKAKYDEQHGVSRRIERRNLLLETLSAASPTVVLLAVMVLLVAEWSRLSLGEFVAFNAALTIVVYALMQATFAAPSFLNAITVFERARPILEEAPEVPPQTRYPPRLTGAVELCDVSFRYAPDGPLVLDEVSIQARPGEFVAIVGPSGSGKSTLLRLLLGFEQPGAGSVMYDGHRLDELDVSAVRRQLGVVLQDAQLLAGATLFDNIAGSRRCTLDDAWSAATAAGLAEDITEMPMGMHTFVAEGSSTLSGGQRQRLLIARAIVSRPGVLLLDEATSALDNRTQEQVAASVERLRVTRVVIAHRLSTIARADRIYVLRAGRVVQSGTFRELMAAGGAFKDLAARQIV